ncbi:MAG TPA: hypothetical protein VKZ18_15110 [Polyangia bacterium]|nr:hypothetical protein [Polyangia bacterium]
MRRRELAAPEPFFAPISRRAALILAAAVVLLLAPWPRLGRLYGGAFCLFGDAVVWTFGLGGEAQPRFSLPDAAERQSDGIDDWTVMLGATAGGGGPKAPLSTRILGYTPGAIFLALLLATPVPARRRLKVAALGSAILLLRLGAAIAIPVAHAFGQLAGSSGAGLLADVAWGSLVDQPALSYVVPVLAWGIGILATAPRAGRANRRKS